MTIQEALNILGLDKTANAEDVKKAYKSQAKKYHPDIYQGDKKFAEEKMKQINEAHRTLEDYIKQAYSCDHFAYGSPNYKFAEEFQRARYEQIKKEQEEQLRKIWEDLERIQKDMEERNKKMKKMFKRLLVFLFCALEFYLSLLLINAVKYTIYYFNGELYFFFAYFILLVIIALAGVILAPIGFKWLLKRAGITK